MLTHEDIKNLTEYQLEVFKDVFATKDDVNRIEVKVDNLTSTVDGLAKDIQTHSGEIAILNHRVLRLEEKVGITPT